MRHPPCAQQWPTQYGALSLAWLREHSGDFAHGGSITPASWHGRSLSPRLQSAYFLLEFADAPILLVVLAPLPGVHDRDRRLDYGVRHVDHGVSFVQATHVFAPGAGSVESCAVAVLACGGSILPWMWISVGEESASRFSENRPTCLPASSRGAGFGHSLIFAFVVVPLSPWNVSISIAEMARRAPRGALLSTLIFLATGSNR